MQKSPTATCLPILYLEIRRTTPSATPFRLAGARLGLAAADCQYKRDLRRTPGGQRLSRLGAAADQRCPVYQLAASFCVSDHETFFLYGGGGQFARSTLYGGLGFPRAAD